MPNSEHSQQGTVLAMVPDMSGSNISNPLPDSQQISEIIDLVTAPQSHIGFGLVTDSSWSRPLIRMEFSLDTLALEGLLLSQRIQAVSENREIRQRYDSTKALFISKIMKMISETPTSNSTDLSGSVDRVATMLDEPIFEQWNRVSCWWTDARNTVSRRPYHSLKGTVVVVGARANDATNFYNEPILFESTIGLIHWIRNWRRAYLVKP